MVLGAVDVVDPEYAEPSELIGVPLALTYPVGLEPLIRIPVASIGEAAVVSTGGPATVAVASIGDGLGPI